MKPHNIDDAVNSNSRSLTAATEIFGISLGRIFVSFSNSLIEECIQKQKHLFPELAVPRVLVHFVDAFYHMKGKVFF